MSKNNGPEQLASEMAQLPRALEAAGVTRSDQAVILARIINGLSQESWQQASQEFSLEEWHAFPVSPDAEPDGMGFSFGFAVSPFREVTGALTKGMFLKLLKREMQRLNRNGGCLSLISAGVGNRSALGVALGEGTAQRLDVLLGATILKRLEECDTLGILRKGQYIICLPGLGQLAARNFAENVRDSFEEAARPFLPGGGITAGKDASCALGIVNILQGETCNAPDLVKRAKTSLEMALRKEDSRIHQESAFAPLENTTLVQSSEKRFLFFGGDPS